MTDAINPSHYKQGSIEFIDALEIVLTPEEFRGFLKGNAMKYLWREKKKQGIEDLRKAKWYLNRLVGLFDEPSKQATPKTFSVEVFWEGPKKPAKFYREPTQADLKNGPIECEYRDFDGDDWVPGYLTGVIKPPCFGFRFRCHSLGVEENWIQCQIEVQE